MCRTKQAGLCLICGTKTTFFDGQDLGLWMAGLALERLVEVIENVNRGECVGFRSDLECILF
jgi:hypothetical protein